MDTIRVELLGVLDCFKDGLIHKGEAFLEFTDVLHRHNVETVPGRKLIDEFMGYVFEILG